MEKDGKKFPDSRIVSYTSEFSLNSISIDLLRPHKSPAFHKLKFLNEISDKEIRLKFLIFLYNLFIDCSMKGNHNFFINDETIYMHRESKQFRYHSSPLMYVSFDENSIIFIHPYYLKYQQRDEILNLKYMLWSVAILFLKYIYTISVDELKILHKNLDYFYYLINFKNISEDHKNFIKICLFYDESDFTHLFTKFRNLYKNNFYLNFEEDNLHMKPEILNSIINSEDKESIKTQSQSNASFFNEKDVESGNNMYPNFKQCPYCSNYMENPSNSKFITCYSSICKGNRFFCWNCNYKLYINDKEKHFNMYGIYSDYCLNITPN